MNLAIIIPFFKIEFFEYCLESLVNQSCKDFRVYIGNDASPEDPSFIISKYSSRLDLIYERFPENLGSVNLVFHWERCLNLCKDEEWVCFLGDDDILDENCVANFYDDLDVLYSENINVFRFANKVINSEGFEISREYYYPRIENSKRFLFNKLYGHTRSSLSEYIFNRKKLLEVRLKSLPLAWHSDELAILEVSDFGDILSNNKSLVLFRNSGINISSKGDNLIEKNKANFEFFYYLIFHYSKNFKRDELEFLWERMEKAFLDDKLHLKFWRMYIYIILKSQNFFRFLQFNKKMWHYKFERSSS